MNRYLLQFRLLLWKNFTLRRRRPIFFAVEIITPLAIVLLLCLVRTRGLKFPMNNCYTYPKAMPGAGTFLFFQSMFCRFNTTCYATEPQLASSNMTTVYKLMDNISDILDGIQAMNMTKLAPLDWTAFRDQLVGGGVVGGSPAQLLKLSLTLLPASNIVSSLLSKINIPEYLSASPADRQQLLADTVIAGILNNGCTNITTLDQYVIFSSDSQRNQMRDLLCSMTASQMSNLSRAIFDASGNLITVQRISDFVRSQSGMDLLNKMDHTSQTLSQLLSQLPLNDLQTILGYSGDKNVNLNGASMAAIARLSRWVCGGQFQDNDLGRTLNNNSTAGQYIITRRRRRRAAPTLAFCTKLLNQTLAYPMFFGKIPYTPDTPLTRTIIQKANFTFQSIGYLARALNLWESSVWPSIQVLLTNDSRIDLLRSVLTVCKDMVLPQVSNSTRQSCASLSDWLQQNSTPGKTNWRDTFNTINPTVANLNQLMSCLQLDKFVPVATEADLVTYGGGQGQQLFWAGVVFDNITNTSSPNQTTMVNIRIRMNTDLVDSTQKFKVLDNFWTPGPRRSPLSDMKYYQYGFSFLQDMLERSTIETLTGQRPDFGLNMQMFPYPCYVNDKFIRFMSTSLPMFMVMAWITTVIMTIRGIVHEKERRLKEFMKVMGLNNAVHWASWFTLSLVMMVISVILMVIMLKKGAVFIFSSGIILFLFMFSYVVAAIAQCFLISVFFSKANIGSVSGGMIYFLLYLPYVILMMNEGSVPSQAVAASCFISQVAYSMGFQYLVRFEQQAIGIQWNNIWSSPSPEDPFSLGKCIAILWADVIIYSILTFYLEAVLPSQYGVRLPWYFPFTRQYWCGDSSKTLSEPTYELNSTQNPDFEAEPTASIVGVAIRNLKKVYGNCNKPAVDGLTVNFYENQITSFLGHNGAGKTTTISILTGIYPPTSGTALLYGRDIRTDLNAIRESLGLCPQYNVLFDYLSVSEHIWFYGLLKGLPSSLVESEIEKYVNDLGLPDKRNELSKNLSGGMKRKLSVAMAFVGGSKVVFLDEPTAGVDPFSRRTIWDLLFRLRQDRTTVLTTHHMDEADILGDRIAIISQGKLKCYGSSIFLKNRFGRGYYIVLEKSDSASSAEGVDTSRSDRLTAFIESYVPGALCIEETPTEWTYSLPSQGRESSTFQNLFDNLDEMMSSLSISSYGISDTSLEEVFLQVADDPVQSGKVGNEEDKLDRLSEGGRFPRPVTRRSLLRRQRAAVHPHPDATACVENLLQDDDAMSSGSSDSVRMPDYASERNTYRLLWNQLRALLIKRFWNCKRSKKGFVVEIILPIVVVFLAVLATMIQPSVQLPPMEIHPWLMAPKRGTNNLYTFYRNDNTSSSNCNSLEALTRTDLGLSGTRCMDPTTHTISDFPCQSPGTTNQWSSEPNSIPNASPPCSCSSGNMVCSNGTAGKPEPSQRLMSSTDFLMNLTGFNISDYLIKTSNAYTRNRYGGVSFFKLNQMYSTYSPIVANLTNLMPRFRQLLNQTNSNNSADFFYQALSFLSTSIGQPNLATIWYNNKGYASGPAYMNVFHNTILRNKIPTASPAQNKWGVSITNHPVNYSDTDMNKQLQQLMLVDVSLSIFVILALSFIPASFVLFLIDERRSVSKHLQFVSGVNPYVYWISNYIWDIMNYTIPCLLCILIFVAFQKTTYIGPDNAPAFVLVMILYGPAIIPMMYPMSHLFDTPSTAFVILSSVNFMIGAIGTLATFILDLLQNDEPDLKVVNDALKVAFLLLPQYCLGRGMYDLSLLTLYASQGIQSKKSVLSWDVVGKNVFCLVAQAVVFFSLCLLIERRFFLPACQGKLKREFRVIGSEEEDVARERQRVVSGEADSDVLRVANLSKVYPRKKKPAVNQLCFSIRKGECFGLLGVNGAGKTSTFKMLTGEESVTEGTAYVNGFSILHDLVRAHDSLGYCPQFDALHELLTGRETLTLYARLRGIPTKEVDSVVQLAIKSLSLTPHANKIVQSYSGGNRRKLSTAVALIGNPKIIFLDEPTSGMDPGAKRFLWDCIRRIIRDGRSVVLTSHSMEECEALCHRLAIMVNGTFRCLGSVQRLKTKYGGGYTVDMKLKTETSRLAELKQFMHEKFPTCVAQEEHFNVIQYQVSSDVRLGYLFSSLQVVKSSGMIEDYSVRQTTLDQVFINFAKRRDEGPISSPINKSKPFNITE